MACCLLVLLPATSSGAVTGLLDTKRSMWATDGTVTAMARSGDTLYVGGSFSRISPSTGGAAMVQNGGLDVTSDIPAVTGTVLDSTSDGLGGWYLAGSLTRAGGVPVDNVVHVLSDGSVDASFVPDFDGAVWSIELIGSTLYAGGMFTEVDGSSRNFIASLDASTGTPTAWAPDADGWVVDLEEGAAGEVYAAGFFANIGGAARQGVAAIDTTTGGATAFDAGADGTVWDVTKSGGTLYVAGEFDNIGGAARGKVAALDTSTAVATAWDPSADGTVFAVTLLGGSAYLGGDFGNVGGAARNRIAEIDLGTGTATAWDPNANATIRTIAVDSGMIYAGGDFVTIGGASRTAVAELDPFTGAATSWNPNPDGQVFDLEGNGTSVLASGTFTTITGVARSNLAAIDISTGTATSFAPDPDGSINSLILDDDTLYVGGSFTSIGGSARDNIAALDTTANTNNATTFDPDADGPIQTLNLRGSTLYVGGTFTSIGGAGRNNIAALDTSADTNNATAFDPNADSTVRAIAIENSGSGTDTVWAGGSFSTIGGGAHAFLAALDASTGSDTAATVDTDADVHALVHDDASSTLYIGGAFGTVDGASRVGVAAIDTSTDAVTSFDPAADSTVRSLELLGTSLFVGGSFSTTGGQSRASLAEIDTATGSATTWDRQLESTAFAIDAQLDAVFVGGNYTMVGAGSNFDPAIGLAGWTVLETVTDVIDGSSGSDEDLSGLGSSLSTSWNGSDQPEIDHFEYCFEDITPGSFDPDPASFTCDGTPDTYSATGDNTTEEGTASSLTLVSGSTYAACVRPVASDGTSGPVACSDGVLLDGEAPDTPLLLAPDNADILDGGTTLIARYRDPAPTNDGSVTIQLCQDVSCSELVDTSTTEDLSNYESASLDVEEQTPGWWYWRARAIDNAGNVGNWSSTRRFLELPAGTFRVRRLTALPRNIVTKRRSLMRFAAVNYAVDYSLTATFNDRTLPVSSSGWVNLAGAAEGFGKLVVTATDDAGRTAIWSRRMLVDRTGPVFVTRSTSSSGNSDIGRRGVSGSWTGSSTIRTHVTMQSSYRLRIRDSLSGTNRHSVKVRGLSLGRNRVRVRLKDRAGNRSRRTVIVYRRISLSKPATNRGLKMKLPGGGSFRPTQAVIDSVFRYQGAGKLYRKRPESVALAREVAWRLRMLGFLSPVYATPDSLSVPLIRAVQRYQKARGIPPIGTIGPKTRASLDRDLGRIRA